MFYSGPFLVEKALGPVNFLIRRNQRAKGMVVHIDKLKICHGDHPPSWLSAPIDEATTVPKIVPTSAQPTPRRPSRFQFENQSPRVTGIPLGDLPQVDRPRRVIRPPTRFVTSIFDDRCGGDRRPSNRTLLCPALYCCGVAVDEMKRPMTIWSRAFRSRVHA